MQLRRLLRRLRLVLVWATCVAVLATAFVLAPRVMTWIYCVSTAIAVPLAIYFWWWMHTWPLHAWRDDD